MQTRPVIYVTPNVEFYGASGYGYEGWAGATPEEAVLEAFLQEGLSIGEATDKLAQFTILIAVQ